MKSALLLIGYQNDYFATDGILRGVVEKSSKVSNVIENTIRLLEQVKEDMLIISTPIIFSENYEELTSPVGILKTIKEVGAFRAGTKGAETIADLQPFADHILEVPGKIGLNAFVNTNLDDILKENQIERVYLAGTVASICIDSTGRSAFEKEYQVTMLADCISGRTIFEKDFYVEKVFPLYSEVMNSLEIQGFKAT